jgi:hypothetical protein
MEVMSLFSERRVLLNERREVLNLRRQMCRLQGQLDSEYGNFQICLIKGDLEGAKVHLEAHAKIAKEMKQLNIEKPMPNIPPPQPPPIRRMETPMEFSRWYHKYRVVPHPGSKNYVIIEDWAIWRPVWGMLGDQAFGSIEDAKEWLRKHIGNIPEPNRATNI